MALTLEKVEEVLGEVDAELAVIGHLHTAAEHRLGSRRRLQVLPAWVPGAVPQMVSVLLDETA
jgi:hypothetical protein